jgi:hypothetical protein
MKLSKVANLNVFADFSFYAQNEVDGGSCNSAVVDMHSDDGWFWSSLLMENSLIDGALGEAQFTDEDMNKLLIPSLSGLL